MARIKFSPLISSIKGKLGNAVFQGGKSGFILRTKAQPRNKNTASQVKARGRMIQVKTLWQNLTTLEKNSWIAFANFYRKTTKFNSTKILSAYELFIQYNTIRLQGDVTPLLTTNFSVFTVDFFDINLKIWYGNDLLLSVEAIGFPTGEKIAVYLSEPFRESSAIAKSKLKYIATGSNDISDLDLSTMYVDLFKRLPSVGDKVLIKIIAYSSFSGWSSKPYFEEIIIEAIS